MTTFEFRRHAIKDGPTSATIGPKGHALARAVGARQLRGRDFTDFHVSGYFRTQQTFVSFAEGAGDFLMREGPTFPPIYVDDPEVWRTWRACHEAEKRGQDMVRAALAHDHAVFERIAREASRLFREWAEARGYGRRVLIVGHSPHMEMLAYGLDATLMPGLRECEGFRVHMTGPVRDPGEEVSRCAFAVERGSADLDPSAIRAELFP
jgi:phosphohistidine phosphatase SixA